MRATTETPNRRVRPGAPFWPWMA